MDGTVSHQHSPPLLVTINQIFFSPHILDQTMKCSKRWHKSNIGVDLLISLNKLDDNGKEMHTCSPLKIIHVMVQQWINLVDSIRLKQTIGSNHGKFISLKFSRQNTIYATSTLDEGCSWQLFGHIFSIYNHHQAHPHHSLSENRILAPWAFSSPSPYLSQSSKNSSTCHMLSRSLVMEQTS